MHPKVCILSKFRNSTLEIIHLTQEHLLLGSTGVDINHRVSFTVMCFPFWSVNFMSKEYVQVEEVELHGGRHVISWFCDGGCEKFCL